MAAILLVQYTDTNVNTKQQKRIKIKFMTLFIFLSYSILQTQKIIENKDVSQYTQLRTHLPLPPLRSQQNKLAMTLANQPAIHKHHNAHCTGEQKSS